VTDGASPEVHHQHRDVTGGWLRPTVFGMMDGLVSNFALIAGVAGAGHSVSVRAVSLAGLAGLVGGAFSMATGEYVSVQSQNESTLAEVEVERHEIRHNSAAEQAELAQLYVERGVEPALAKQVAAQLSRDPDQALTIHVREELGTDPKSLPSPWTAAGSSLLSFSLGALIPLLPYLCGMKVLWLSAVLALAALFVAGAVTARFTERDWVFSGVRQLVLGGLAAAVTYGVGQAFGAVVG
jgi:VIT1/CCC1 family predicted Fe2+/Mn2+ transporter